jgi:hypothetical protein
MSYATKACSQLTAAPALRRLAGSSSNSLNCKTWHAFGPLLRQGEGRFSAPYCSSPRYFTTSSCQAKNLIDEETARETNERDKNTHEKDVQANIQEATKQQIKRPWQREGADKPPVDESARNLNKTMTKGYFPLAFE